MKNYLVLMSVGGQLITYLCWCVYLKRQHPKMWERTGVKKVIFIFALLLIFGIQWYRLSYPTASGDDRWPYQFAGEFLVKGSFLFVLGTCFTYSFLIDKKVHKRAVFKTNKLLDVAIVIVSVGFALLNLDTYVWIAEMVFLPLCVFLLSLQD